MAPNAIDWGRLIVVFWGNQRTGRRRPIVTLDGGQSARRRPAEVSPIEVVSDGLPWGPLSGPTLAGRRHDLRRRLVYHPKPVCRCLLEFLRWRHRA